MTEENKKPQAEVTPDAEVRYTESFARERERKSRRGSLFVGIGALILGSIIARDSVIAIRTGTLVALGRSDRGGLYWPPFIAGPIGLLTLLFGLWISAGLIFRRR